MPGQKLRRHVALREVDIRHIALLKRVGLPAFPGLAAGGFQRQMERVYDAVTEVALAAALADAVGEGWAEEVNGEREKEPGV
ncbi:MAG: hypothetical protein RBU35_13945 [Anaerolineae bacterium]|mgnify:CR=1 FL=1|jgi:hypothetical protein|nr:hypothetical protein [Anaerolineae bacterium]